MNARLIIASALLLSACTKKAEESRPQVEEQAQPIAPAPECAEFGKTMRSLAFRDAALALRRSVPDACKASWGARLDVVAQSFWLQLDCSKPETKALLDAYLATPSAMRADAEAFPNDPKSSPSVAAFLEAAAPVIRTTSEEILRLGDEMGDGGCARAL